MLPAGQRRKVSYSTITANYDKTDPEKSIGDIEGVFIKKDNGKTVFGVGTKAPVSRISMGEYSTSETIPALAFTEDGSGNGATGIVFNRNAAETEYSLIFSINEVSIPGTSDFSSLADHEENTPILTLKKTKQAVASEILTNGEVSNTGNKVFINCVVPIRGAFSQRSGLEVNGMISLTDQINFLKSSISEDVSVDPDDNRISLYHTQTDGTRIELLTREGHNRVVDVSNTLISVLPNSSTGTPRGPDPPGIFLFKNCDFVIGNGEMAASTLLDPNDEYDENYWSKFENIFWS